MQTQEAGNSQLAVPRWGYSVLEASRLLGISQSCLWQWISENKLKSVKIGNRRIITAHELQRLLNEGLQ
jgi:excisionase family DNA binding protein